MKRRTYFVIHAIIIMFLLCIGLASSMEHQNQQRVVNHSFDHDIYTEEKDEMRFMPERTNVQEVQDLKEEESKGYVFYRFSKDWGSDDTYLLAKIAECEGGNQSIECREKIIQTVLNRVWDPYFPNSIKDVIFQHNGDLYQFSPCMEGGLWWYTEPTEESYEAVENVMKKIEDDSEGVLYFEACESDSWHSRSLEFLYQIDDTRFYK